MREQLVKWLNILVIIVMVLGAAHIYHKYINPSQPITYLPANTASTVAGVSQAANNAHVSLSQEQKQEIADSIKTPEPAVEKVVVMGVELPKKVDYLRMRYDAQMAVVTDPNNPNKPPVVKPNDTVNLDVHLIKAYPKQLLEVTYSTDNTASIMNYWRIKVVKETAYFGAGVDIKDKNVRAKLGILIPH